MGEPGGLTDHHPDAGAAVATRGQLLDPAVVEPGRRTAPVLGEDLGEVAAGSQRAPKTASTTDSSITAHSFFQGRG